MIRFLRQNQREAFERKLQTLELGLIANSREQLLHDHSRNRQYMSFTHECAEMRDHLGFGLPGGRPSKHV